LAVACFDKQRKQKQDFKASRIFYKGTPNDSFNCRLNGVKMVDIHFNCVEGKTVVYLNIYCVSFLFELRIIKYTGQEPNLVPTLSELRVELDKAVIFSDAQFKCLLTVSRQFMRRCEWLIS
jgi:hypothetical protein